MGSSMRLVCNNCNYQREMNLGIGMMYPHVCKEELKKIEAGERGEEAKLFLDDNDDAAVNCEIVPMRCDNCGELASNQAQTLYASYPKDIKPWIGSSLTFVLNKNGVMKHIPPIDEIDRETVKILVYGEHQCEECGGKMRQISVPSIDEEDVEQESDVKCPRCGHNLEVGPGLILWD